MDAVAKPREPALDLESAAAEYLEAAAVECLTAALRRHGCTVGRQTVGTAGLLQADVWKGTGHMLMCLRAALAPGEPAALTGDQVKAFRLAASRANADPWVAYMVIGPDMDLIRLDWRPLEE